MDGLETCPECATSWQDGQTCEDYFHQMLFWEFEFPELGIVHHYAVLCYHMQHPSLYSPETLEVAKTMLADFLSGVSPAEMRALMRDKVDSGQRKHKIRGTAEAGGVYQHPVSWSMTAQDVVAAGSEQYIERVKAWAQSIYDALKVSDNL